MRQTQKEAIWMASVVATLVLIATWIGYILVEEGGAIIPSAFGGAFISAPLLAAYGAGYQLWARAIWGAPFVVGDRVRIVRGPPAGTQGVVVSLGHGVEVEVEFESSGQPCRKRMRWGAIRRAVPR